MFINVSDRFRVPPSLVDNADVAITGDSSRRREQYEPLDLRPIIGEKRA